ncbi:NAD-dependent epimerase/dehydratase family protein [Acinetobacter pittii]|uniref:NAD-dependent epimerase/dehydratase family protein n=1 Tax=Acinetobacter pittii TaxID=48296 RepID=UPI0024DE3A42|nr:NAD-dependent epimerase/dehydratase family protein [Acinetobacter pittii]
MHILFIGYGKTSQRVAKQLFEKEHQITTISRSVKTDSYATHLVQDIFKLDLSKIEPVDVVYILLSPNESTVEGYQHTYVDSIEPIREALKIHPVKKIIVVSSTRVYGENAGEIIDDFSEIHPNDAQGNILRNMELLWQKYYPTQSIIIRPTGIYGTSIARLKKMAENHQSYPNIHYSNRIHIDDLARFLAFMADYANHQASYIVTNNQPLPLHEVIAWFQKQLGLPELTLESNQISGKRIYAKHLSTTGFQLEHPICFNDYLLCLNVHSTK